MSVAQTRDEQILIERTNRYLATLNSHSFKSDQLKQQAPLRFTDINNITGVSDDGLVMDPDDKDKVNEDLMAFKKTVSRLKFAYLESNLKLAFAEHITEKDGPKLVPVQDIDRAEQERVAMKEELRAKKREAAELEALIREESEILEKRMQGSKENGQLAARLLRESEEMELELTMLKNKRTPMQRITIEEAQVLSDEQMVQFGKYGPEGQAIASETKATTQQIRQYKIQIDKLDVAKRELKKELDEREAKGKRDERAEKGCRWITASTALYSSIMGIRSAEVMGSPPSEIRIVYDSPHGNEGDYRALSIKVAEDGKMEGATLLDSSDDIQDIVQAHLKGQDVTSMILEVQARIRR
ncbi:hypothetical protein T439DRAFT_324295 [Meredithblackwellia eburnea MCA 4105]